ncbi:hypothetical protein FFK22_011305 [Mycobacterium sp. KBS0706]|uniref:hypothetical protein n=1 Tax=Mycobacterium sp. KBS0706 TaxID=2578109 RepID=UPI00110FDE2A|nr:hypothetical protein [Mycobacterium sp. KBS0706]TSD88640.1 hypothetical protein FFK22_011305 [Mycobacterium sp. KBS0706]
MGRQIAIVMNDQDEQNFLTFLRSTCNIALFEYFAPTEDALRVEDFHPERTGHWTYRIWNRSYPWHPTFGQTGPKSHNPDQVGWAYISNAQAAPVLEFTRSNPAGRPGRIYWARTFSATAPLRYDDASFSRWVDRVWQWVRNNGVKADKGNPSSPYILPGAAAD